MSNLPRRTPSGEAIFRTITAADWKRSLDYYRSPEGMKNPIIDGIQNQVMVRSMGRRALPMYSGSELSPAKDPEKDEHEKPAA